MAIFEPQFTWHNGVISEKALPIIIQSVNPSKMDGNLVIARMQTKDSKLKATTSTELAIKA